MSGVLYVATLVAAIGCGLVAGVFFAFSSFVMPALARLPAAQGIAAMQFINVQAVTPLFMTALFGPAIVCLGLAGWAVTHLGERPSALVFAGCALYLVGTIGTTIVFNVPLNNRLAGLDPQSSGAGDLWSRYLTAWTAAWNHGRTVVALAASLAFTVALQVPTP
jgi:uncharacterized membrane protein